MDIGLPNGVTERSETREGMVVQHCECNKCHWTVHFNMAHFVLCDFHLNLKKKVHGRSEISGGLFTIIIFSRNVVLTDSAPGASDCHPSVRKAQGDAALDTAPKSG